MTTRPTTLPVPQAHPHVVGRRPAVLPTAVATVAAVPRALPVAVTAPVVLAEPTRVWPARRPLPEGYADSIKPLAFHPKRPYIEVAENPIGVVVVRVPDHIRTGEAQDILESFHRMPIAEMPRRAWQWRHYRNKYEHWGHSIPDYSTRRKVEASLALAKKLTAPIYPLKPEHQIGHLVEVHTVVARKTGDGLVGGARYIVEAAVCRETDVVEAFGKQRRRARNVLELRFVPFAPAPDPDRDMVHPPPPPVYTWREGRDPPRELLDRIVIPNVDDIAVTAPKALKRARAAVAAIEQEATITLFDWQREDIARAVVAERCLIAHAMGLGKSILALFIAAVRVRLGAPNLALFVVPQDLIEQWQGEARERLGTEIVRIESPAAVMAHEESVRLGYTRRDAPKPMTPRQARDFIKAGGRGFFITHYEALSRAGRVFEEPPSSSQAALVRSVAYQKLSEARHRADAAIPVTQADEEIAKSGYAHLKNAFRDAIVVVDECFAPDTPVDLVRDGRVVAIPIRDVQVGDTVLSAAGLDAVTAVTAKQITSAVRVRAAGRTFVCSANHPVLTQRGWIRAGKIIAKEDQLCSTSAAVRMVQKEPRESAPQESFLRSVLLGEMENEATVVSGDAVHAGNRREDFKGSPQVVCCWVRSGRSSETSNPRRKQNACAFGAGSDDSDSSRTGSCTPSTGRKRGGTNAAGSRLTAGAGTSLGISGRDFPRRSPEGFSDSIQGGLGECVTPNCNRIGWSESPGFRAEGGRSEEGNEAAFLGVERVEILEPGCSELDRWRAPDGSLRFYDLSVARHPSFSVEGVLVHNCTKIKGTESDRGKAIRALKAKRRYALTGTPVKNRLEDIFWLLQWVGGGKRFPYSVSEGPAAFLNDFGVRESLKAPSGATKAGWCPDAGNLHLLRRLLAPLMIRRTAAEILSSKLTYRIVPAFVPFGVEQRKAYQAWLDSTRFGQWWQAKHKLLDPVTLAIAQLSHLEYASTCPEADAAREYYEAGESPSNWTPKALRALEEVYKAVLAGERVLFGSITLGLVAWVVERLREAGVEVVSLIRPKKNEAGYSSLLPAERASIIRDFGAGKAQVLATGMRAMALGHNLDMITTVVTAGLPWEHDVYEQYLARARRLSSVKPVTMHVIMTDGSLDQRKWELLQAKRATSSLVVDAVELIDDTVSIDYQAILAELQARGVATDEAVVDERSCAATWAETVRRGVVTGVAAPLVLDKPSANLRATLQVAAALSSGYPVLAWEGHRAELGADGRFSCYRCGTDYPLISGWAYDAAKAFVDLVGAAAAHRALRLARMGPEAGRAFLEWWKTGPHTWESPRVDWWRFGSHTWMGETDGGSGS